MTKDLYNYMISFFVKADDSQIFLENIRSVLRKYVIIGGCTSFIPINRPIENKIDCYIFGSSFNKIEIENYFKNIGSNIISVSKVEMSPELQLVKNASNVVELLLQNYSNNEIYDKLFREHFHYIFNSLGHTYESEAQLYLMFHKIITEYLLKINKESFNAS